jgi:hypothetical protein
LKIKSPKKSKLKKLSAEIVSIINGGETKECQKHYARLSG